MKRQRHWAILILLMFMVSCGIGGDLKRAAKSRKQALEETQAKIESARNRYNQWKTAPEYARFERYDKAYNWSAQYRDALAEAESAAALWEEIRQILKADQPEAEAELKVKIDQINSRLNLALEKSKQPNQQIDALRQLMGDASTYVETGERQVAEMGGISSDLEPVADEAVQASQQFGWGKEKEIANRFSTIAAMYTASAAALSNAQAQFKAGDPDYGVMADNLRAIAQKLPAMKAADHQLRQQLGQLNRSFTKQLIDMKYAYRVSIGRTSWNDAYDFPKETDYIYPPREVDEAAFDKLAESTGTIATGARYGIRPRITRSVWDKLGIDAGEKLPYRDDSAEFWVNDAEIQYYHRYRLIENGQKTETGWQPVDEDLFSANIDNLGMDIISKPYGMYAFEANQEAAPPGMAYVGNDQYGHWQKDSAGNSFWAFYGRYAFLNALLGGNRYSYNDWQHWKRDYRGRKPYYGENVDGTRRYGTSGSTVLNSPAYKSTTFAKRGGIKAAPADVKSAADSVRGRGPGRRGK
jgi:hypothetical protein